MGEQQQQQQQPQWEPGRELFEALLSNPAVGAAEAIALLGTCRAARGVGGAASLSAIRTVAVVDSEAYEPELPVPLIRDLEPVRETLVDEWDGEGRAFHLSSTSLLNLKAFSRGYVTRRSANFFSAGRRSAYFFSARRWNGCILFLRGPRGAYIFMKPTNSSEQCLG